MCRQAESSTTHSEPAQNSHLAESAVRRAFTAIELLVVVAVIAILAAMLLPALRDSRAIGRQTLCVANLRQWVSAANLYASDNCDFLPRRGQGVQPTTTINRPADWFNALPPYLHLDRYAELAGAARVARPGSQGVWMCPDAVDTGMVEFFAYAMNMWLSTWDAALPDRLDRVGPIATMVFMADGPGTHCSTLPSDRAFGVVARHRSRTPIAFLDQHVFAYAGVYVGCGVGDPQRADVRWRVPGSSWPGP